MAEIRRLFHVEATEVHPRYLFFTVANNFILGHLLGLEIYGALFIVAGVATCEEISSDLGSIIGRLCSSIREQRTLLELTSQYRSCRGRSALSTPPTVRLHYRTATNALQLNGRALVAAAAAALSENGNGTGWRMVRDDPELCVTLVLRSAREALVLVEWRAKNGVPSSLIRPDLSSVLSEDYVKQRRAELRKMQRSKLKERCIRSDNASFVPPLASINDDDDDGDVGDGDEAEEDEGGNVKKGAAPQRLARAEGVLSARTGRFIVVLERSNDLHNQFAILRTSEAFGIQHVWFVVNPNTEATDTSLFVNRKITKVWSVYLSLLPFFFFFPPLTLQQSLENGGVSFASQV